MNPTYRDECVRLLVLSAIKLCALIIYVNVGDTPVSIIRVTTAEESVKIWKYFPRTIPILYYWKHICKFLSPFFLLNIMYFVIGYSIYSLYLLQLQNIKVNTIQKLMQLKINSNNIKRMFSHFTVKGLIYWNIAIFHDFIFFYSQNVKRKIKPNKPHNKELNQRSITLLQNLVLIVRYRCGNKRWLAHVGWL